MSALKGIDISHHQNGINIAKLDVDFVICKATEGIGLTDECCDKFYQKAKSLGKKLGVYHYARPDLGNSAINEADYFIKETKGYHKEAILVLDWEGESLKYSTNWAKQWLDRVYEKTGVKPILYIQASVLSQDWSKVVKADYGLWVANYGSNNGQPQESAFNKHPLKHWSFYALWQYTSKGKINGYNGNLDLNYFYGTKDAWDKYANPKTTNSSSNTQPSISTDKKADQVLYEGSKVQFYGCQIDDIKTVGSKTTFYSKKYGVWLPITSWYRVDEKGEKYANQMSSKGNWLMNNSVYTVKSVSKNPDRAVITVEGKDYSVLSAGLYEVANS